MFGSVILEVAIGIIFIFILFSIMCSCIREGLEALLKTRAAYLEAGIRELLNDKSGNGIVKAFYSHPLIHSLFSKNYKPGKPSEELSLLARGRDLPSYIPAKNFARTLMDIAARGKETDAVSGNHLSPRLNIHNIRTNISNIDNYYVQRAVLTALDSAQDDLNLAQQAIQDWYDSAMDRVSGWYKRATYWILFWIGLVLAVSLNINTLAIADYLYKDDPARKVLVARAEAAAKDSSFTSKTYDESLNALNELRLPIGWAGETTVSSTTSNTDDATGFQYWDDFFQPVLGWLITALAAVVGAPFWFDLLNKIMIIRATVKPHEKSPEEASEDRQPNNKQARAVPAGHAAARPLQNIDAVDEEKNYYPNVRDSDSSIDNCTVGSDNATADDQLPEAKGGVKDPS